MNLHVNSLYTKILVTCAATLSISLLAFLIIFLTVGRENSRANFFELGRLEIDMVIAARDADGEDGVRRALRRLDDAFGSVHYAVDRNGIDLLTGEDLTALMDRNVNTPSFIPQARNVLSTILGSKRVSVNPTLNGDYSLVTISEPWDSVRAQVPYYLVLLLVVSGLYSMMAVRLVASLRGMARAADNLGKGDLTIRVQGAQRRDEIGDLARAFNAMADKIGSLLTSERRLLQDVSHELRSPLARLSFAAELARKAPDRDAAIDQIVRQLNSLTRLVTNLLDLTRYENGSNADMGEPVAIDPLVHDIVAASALHAQERSCTVMVTGATHRVVKGNEKLLARAIDNVLRNAIHYSPPRGVVEVTLSGDPEMAIISIRDQGCGVPEAMLGRIFEPFFRVDASREASTGGTGLGLAIVQRVVQAHLGTVSAENVQSGLKVTLRLPAAEQRASLDSQHPHAAA